MIAFMLLCIPVISQSFTSRLWASEQLFVAPGGSDAAPGTRSHPLASPEGARDSLRRLRQRSGPKAVAGATVWLLSGEYELHDTLTLDQQDSGEEGKPVTYRAVPGARVVISGGIQMSDWRPVYDRIYLLNLPAISSRTVLEATIPSQFRSRIAAHAAQGFARSVTSGSELFFAGRPMTLARWPNTGWTYTDRTQPTTSRNQFRYAERRISDWVAAPDAWFRGYWRWSWADFSERAAGIDPQNALVTTEPPDPGYGYAANRPFFGFNLLSELDKPGEYYFDRVLGNVLFLPPGGSLRGTAHISVLDGPLVRMNNASYVALQDLTLSYGRGSGVIISGGRSDLVSHCRIESLGGAGVRINDGFGHAVVSSELAWLGEEGVTLSGGDRRTLTPSQNVARDNHIHDFARQTRTLRPGIALAGVGNAAIHNLIHDAPHQAISIQGNDHTIADNEIYRVAMETQDVGAIYIGRDWTERGNQVRHNNLHDLGNGDVTAVYLDDQASGTIVEDNYFMRLPRGVLIGGGRENIVRRNVFLDVETPVHVDARGLGSDPQTREILVQRYAAVHADKPPFSERYPSLAHILADQPEFPKGNVVADNFYTTKNWLDLRDGLKPEDVGALDNTYLSGLRFDPIKNTLTDTSVKIERSGVRFPTVDLNMIGPGRDAFPGWFNGSETLNIGFDGSRPGTNAASLTHEGIKVVRLRLWNVGRTPLSGAVALWAYPRELTVLSVRRVPYSLRPNEIQYRDVDVHCSPSESAVLVGYQEEGVDAIPPPIQVSCPDQ